MHCFVLGATGFLGSHVASGLLDRGDSVSGLTSSKENISKLQKRRITPVLGNILKPEEWVDRACEADAVVHCALLPLPQRPTNSYVEKTIEAERTLLNGILPSLADSNTAFLYTSGTGIYGDSEMPCKEDYPTNPLARSKKDVVGERIVLKASKKNGLMGTVMRPAPIYGAGGLFHKFWGTRLADQKKVIYPGKGDQKWSYVSVWDCARAYLLALDNPSNGEIYNVSDGKVTTPKEFLSELTKILDAPDPIGLPKVLFRLLAGKIYAQAMFSSFPATNDKIKDKLGFQPVHSNYKEGAQALMATYNGNEPKVYLG